jgi:hypothetical protein
MFLHEALVDPSLDLSRIEIFWSTSEPGPQDKQLLPTYRQLGDRWSYADRAEGK